MAEEPLWKGTSSQWKNLLPHTIFVAALGLSAWLYWGKQMSPWIFLLAGVAALWSLWSFFVVKSTEYQLTTERLIRIRGILTRVTDTLELYRVRDLQIVQPLLLRILKQQNIHVITTDSTTAELILDYLPASDDLGERLRKSIEECRTNKRVRTMDVISENPGDHPGDHSDTALT